MVGRVIWVRNAVTVRRDVALQRDDVPGILQPGKVGLFGGHRENDETYLQCAVREIQEENVAPDRFEHLVSYDGVEFEPDGGSLRGEFFIVRDVPVDALTVTEGSLLIVEPNELASVERNFAPSVRIAINALLDRKAARRKRVD